MCNGRNHQFRKSLILLTQELSKSAGISVHPSQSFPATLDPRAARFWATEKLGLDHSAASPLIPRLLSSLVAPNPAGRSAPIIPHRVQIICEHRERAGSRLIAVAVQCRAVWQRPEVLQRRTGGLRKSLKATARPILPTIQAWSCPSASTRLKIEKRQLRRRECAFKLLFGGIAWQFSP
jgi:hypothetical protein